MNWSDFSGKSIALLGAGKENLSLIPHLLRAQAVVTVCDRLETPNLAPGVKQVGGENYLTDLDKYDYVFRSPGLPPREIEKILKDLTRRPIVTSATNLFLEAWGSQVIGVTGTKGKGTTSTMIAEILKAAGKPTILAGNIGNSVFDGLDKITDQTMIVLELSSFQLEDINHSPHVAVVLPIVADHLQPLSERSPNYHSDLGSYIKAKEQITAHQQADDVVVFSLESQASEQIGHSAVAKKVSVSLNQPADVQVVDKKVVLQNGEVDLSTIPALKGDHMYHNAAMAIAVGSTLGVTSEAMVSGLKNFRPLPHRMESVGTYNGIEFVDDSYATAPDATIAALSAYPNQPIILILGGSSKGADFSKLAETVHQANVKCVVLIGQEAKRLDESISKISTHTPRLSGFSVFKDAVETAVHRAVAGDVVLLSPACASKDMFTDAADRGDQFTKIVHELL